MFALWLQIGLSFGHIHPRHALAAEAQPAGHAAALIAAPRRLPDDPIKNTADRVASEACAICASIDLAATAVPPQPPALSPPVRAGWRVAAAADFALPAIPHRLFQTRAPPV